MLSELDNMSEGSSREEFSPRFGAVSCEPDFVGRHKQQSWASSSLRSVSSLWSESQQLDLDLFPPGAGREEILELKKLAGRKVRLPSLGWRRQNALSHRGSWKDRSYPPATKLEPLETELNKLSSFGPNTIEFPKLSPDPNASVQPQDDASSVAESEFSPRSLFCPPAEGLHYLTDQANKRYASTLQGISKREGGGQDKTIGQEGGEWVPPGQRSIDVREKRWRSLCSDVEHSRRWMETLMTTAKKMDNVVIPERTKSVHVDSNEVNQAELKAQQALAVSREGKFWYPGVGWVSQEASNDGQKTTLSSEKEIHARLQKSLNEYRWSPERAKDLARRVEEHKTARRWNVSGENPINKISFVDQNKKTSVDPGLHMVKFRSKPPPQKRPPFRQTL